MRAAVTNEQFEEACPACNGRPERRARCEECEGRGTVPTATGRQVLMLLAMGHEQGREFR